MGTKVLPILLEVLKELKRVNRRLKNIEDRLDMELDYESEEKLKYLDGSEM